MDERVNGGFDSHALYAQLEILSREIDQKINIQKLFDVGDVDYYKKIGFFNWFILTSQDSHKIPDGDLSVPGLGYITNGNLILIKDIDKVFLNESVSESTRIFEQIKELVNRYFSNTDAVSLSSFMDSVKSHFAVQLKRGNRSAKEIEEEIEEIERQLASLQRNLLNVQSSNQVLFDQMAILANTDWDQSLSVLSSLKDLYYEKFYQDGKVFYGVTKNIVLETSMDVYDDHDDEYYEKDFCAYLGQLLVVLSFEDGGLYVKVIPYLDNKYDEHEGDYYHPHVDYNGAVCMGDMYNALHQHLVSFDIPGAFNIVAQILFDYNDENPFKSIRHFSE